MKIYAFETLDLLDTVRTDDKVEHLSYLPRSNAVFSGARDGGCLQGACGAWECF